jgi:hypothetical protein
VTEDQTQMPGWILGSFPILFVLLWLAATSLFGLLSNWFELQRQFPRNDDQPLLRLRMRSGRVGLVGIGGALSLAACRSGLRVGILRLLGPFQRPFQIPWDQIEAEPVSRFFEPAVRLRFGRPEVGRLVIDSRSWERLKAAAAGQHALRSTEQRGRLARSCALQWAVLTLFAGSFFYFVSRYGDPSATPVPAAIFFGLPAAVFGVSQFIRFAIQAR